MKLEICEESVSSVLPPVEKSMHGTQEQWPLHLMTHPNVFHGSQ